MPPDSALSIEGVSFSFGERKALDGVSFAVAPGSFTALLGPNGAGKSTLFALITRLLGLKDGAISVFGADMAREPGKALARMGVVFQQPTLDLDLSVAQNLHYFASLQGLPKAKAETRIEAELARPNLTERRADKVRALNGGHRRRVEIARALLHQPSLLLLDEPTVGLDLPTRRQIVAHVHKLAREDGIAVLWATHLIDEVEEGDDVVVLHKGSIRAAGPLDQVLAGAGAGSVGEAFDRLTGGPA